jgi:hypothetical protein
MENGDAVCDIELINNVTSKTEMFVYTISS